MLHIGIFIVCLFALFILSRYITRHFSYFLYRVTGHHTSGIHLFAIFFFPGTFVHEMSHYVTAILLGVHAGKMEFIPEVHGDSIKMGSVRIAKTGLVRRFLIGVAPLVWGVGIILSLIYFVVQFGVVSNLWVSGGVLLLVFIIGNTMYSSRRDMEGAVGLFVIVAILFALVGGFFWYTGTSLPSVHISFIRGETIYTIFETGWKFLLVPVGIDLIILFLFQLFLRK